jgi:thymidylate synthase ThyX
MIQATVLCDSVSPKGTRLTTLRVTMPRFVLAEFNTHRVFSRNAGSSRAISVTRRLTMVKEHPVIPLEWGVEQRGMQATQMLDRTTADHALDVWFEAQQAAFSAAEKLATLGVHKQVVNRLLEPFSWVQVVVTSAEWKNFFTLRDSPLAQPEMRQTAIVMREAFENSIPKSVAWGEWHAPTITAEDLGKTATFKDLLMVAAGRLARVSYEASPKTLDEDRLLAERLVADGHWSPFEHIAQAHQGRAEWCRNYVRDWDQFRAILGG